MSFDKCTHLPPGQHFHHTLEYKEEGMGGKPGGKEKFAIDIA